MASDLLKPVRNWQHCIDKIGGVIDMTVVKVRNFYNTILLQGRDSSIQKVMYLYESKAKCEITFHKIPFIASSCTRLSNSRVAFACDRHIVYMRPHPSRLVVWATTDTSKTYSTLCSIDQNKMWAYTRNENDIHFVDMIDFDGKILKSVELNLTSSLGQPYMVYSPTRTTLFVSRYNWIASINKDGGQTTRDLFDENESDFRPSSLTVNDKGRIVFVDSQNFCVCYMKEVTETPDTVLSLNNCTDLTNPQLIHIYEGRLFVFNKTEHSGDIFMFYLKDLNLK